MYNFYDVIAKNPSFHRQLNCRNALLTLFNCPLENKFQDLWTHHSYVMYVMEGRKIWHTAHGSYDLRQGSCVFVRNGASIVEQFFDGVFCIVLFFVPDEFICDTLKTKTAPITNTDKKYEPVIALDSQETLQAFFHSMMPYFGNSKDPDPSLLELKFRELILAIADNPKNTEIQSYFYSLLQQPQAISLQKIMEDNYCFNLKLEEFAQLSHRSLSAFKRDFQKQFNATPGKWLLEKRLNHAMNLLSNTGKTVNEAAFESGFESPSHFSRSFRQHFGMAPTAARQQIPI